MVDNIGKTSSNSTIQQGTPAGVDPARAEISAAAGTVSPARVNEQARQIGNGDSYQREAGLSRPQGLQDGDFLDDPRRMTPDQAEHLTRLLDDPNLSDRAKTEIRGFLEDWRNGVDRLRPPGEPDLRLIRPPTYREEG